MTPKTSTPTPPGFLLIFWAAHDISWTFEFFTPTWVPNLVAVRRSCRKGGGGTDRHTQRDTATLYSRLAGYPASLGPLLPVRFSLPPSPPPSSPLLPLSILGLPGFDQNICVIVQENCFPESYFEIWSSKIPNRGGGVTFLSICRQIMKYPGFLNFFTSKPSWGGGGGKHFLLIFWAARDISRSFVEFLTP